MLLGIFIGLVIGANLGVVIAALLYAGDSDEAGEL